MSHDLFHLPLADPVMIFALAMAVFVSGPLFFERFPIPSIIGSTGSVVERLPWHLDDEVPNSFVVVYPSETESEPQRQPSALRLPGAIEPDRVVLGLPRAPFQQTLEQLVGEAVPDDAELRRAVWEALVRRELDGATELVPGVVAPNARV
jgi:hypothetical protein